MSEKEVVVSHREEGSVTVLVHSNTKSTGRSF